MRCIASKISINALFFLLWLGYSATAWGNITIASWNVQHLGARKPDSVIDFMAHCLRDFDVVALQEINTGNGAQAVARLADALNRMGQQWDYCVSDPTTAPQPGEAERYAYLWKKAKVQRIGRPYLAQVFEAEISREPFIAVFRSGTSTFSLVNFHALPKKKQPEQEIKYLKYFPDSLHLLSPVFLGDFNCPQSHSVFYPLKRRAYLPALQGQRTTLKQECAGGDCLASEYDNIFYPATIFRLKQATALPFYQSFDGNMKLARSISDHLPVYAELVPLDAAP